MTATRKICLVVTSDVSAKAFHRGYLRYLRVSGWDVTLIASSTGLLEPLVEEEGVRGVAVSMQRNPDPIRDIASAVQLFVVIRRIKPDVVVSATPKASLLTMLVSRALGVTARVYVMWGLRLETETGVRRWVYRTLERVTAASATVVLANGPSLAAAARSERISKEISVIGPGSASGIDIERFSPQASVEPVDLATAAFIARHPGRITIGYVGRVNRDKGLPALFDAARLCEQRGVGVKLLIVGPTESLDLEAALASLSDSIPVRRVQHVDDPRGYFLSMDIHCLPTLREGFPNVVLEAAGLGIPTITTRATGARDSVVDGVTGLLVPVSDPEALAAAIERCVADRHLLPRLAAAGRKRVVEEFSQSRIWSLNELFLRRLVGR